MELWKAADQHYPSDIGIRNFVWEIKGGVPSPCIDPGPTGPPALMNAISWRCRAAVKARAAICSCKKEGLSCTIYCLCQSGDECCNPHKGRNMWMMMTTKRTASHMRMELWMHTVLLIERSFIAFIIVILFHLCNHSNQNVLCTAC